jgi:integrase/recombinase XerD
MRVGEVAALSYAHVLNADGSVRDQIPLSANETKGRHPRAVFVSPRLRKEIAAYVAAVPPKNANAALFYTQKCPERGFTANTLTQFFLTLYARAGIEGASSHSGRRSFATALAAKGTGIRVLMRLMGHRNIAVTATYIDANDDMLRNAVALL